MKNLKLGSLGWTAALLFLGLMQTGPVPAAPLCTYGPQQCLPGYVWREAFPGDMVCVTPDVRAQAASDNAQATARKIPSGQVGQWGPDTCVMGYVWREANPTDHVCVAGAVRTQTAADNAAAASRVDPACTPGGSKTTPPNVAPAITNRPVTPNGTPGSTAVPAANAPALPTWPQKFEVNSTDHATFGLPVGKPGAVSVRVQAQGAPLAVTLMAQGGRVVAERQGSGQISIDYAASPADLSAGIFWSVAIRVAAPPTTVPGPALAGGSIIVNYPAPDPSALQTALQAETQKAQAAKMQLLATMSAAPRVDLSAIAQQMQAKADQQAAQQHLAQRVALDAQFPIRTLTGTRGTVANSGTLGTGVGGQLGNRASSGSKSVAATGAPSLTLDKSQGDPGTPVNVAGANFGDNPGEIHIIVANGNDRIATFDFWSDGQIRFVVPDVPGIPVYDGVVYVKRADGVRSSFVPFRFLPRLKTVLLNMPMNAGNQLVDSNVQSQCPGSDIGSGCQASNMSVSFFNWFYGLKGDDEFFVNTRMVNGWTVQEARVMGPHLGVLTPGSTLFSGSGAATVADVRVGSNSPYVKFHWWIGAASELVYQPVVVVAGPVGLPCGVALPDGSDACMH